MKKILKLSIVILCIILLIACVLPFLIPVPPLQGVVPPEQLSDNDSKFININNLQIHYKYGGQGEPAFVLLHGFLTSTYTWRELFNDLANKGSVVAFDRPAFGLSERPLEWEGSNPYSSDAQVDITIGLMDALGLTEGVLVGNSAGGTIALLTALKYPERVKALILLDPAVYTGSGTPMWIKPLLSLPQFQRLGPLILRGVQNWGKEFGKTAWYDPSKITPQIWEEYTLPLRAKNWDRGLWEFMRANKPSDIEKNLGNIQIPVLVITGENDRIVPPEQTIRLGKELPNAQTVVIPSCGHIPQEECPEAVLAAIDQFLQNNKLTPVK